MTQTDRGDLAMRASTLLVLTATMLGLLVWYGSITGGLSVATSLLDGLSGAVGGLGTVAMPHFL